MWRTREQTTTPSCSVGYESLRLAFEFWRGVARTPPRSVSRVQISTSIGPSSRSRARFDPARPFHRPRHLGPRGGSEKKKGPPEVGHLSPRCFLGEADAPPPPPHASPRLSANFRAIVARTRRRAATSDARRPLSPRRARFRVADPRAVASGRPRRVPSAPPSSPSPRFAPPRRPRGRRIGRHDDVSRYGVQPEQSPRAARAPRGQGALGGSPGRESRARRARRARRGARGVRASPGGPPRGSAARSRTRARGALVARRARGGRREGRARGRRRARARRLRGVALPLAPPRAPGRAHALAVVHPPARRRGGPGGGNEALRPRRVSSRRPRTRPRARPPRRRSKRKRPPLDAVASRRRHARRSERGRFWETAKKKRRTNASRRLLAFSPSPRRAVPRGVAALLGRARRLRSSLLALPRVPPRRGLERLAPRPPPPGRIGKRIEKKGHPVGDGRVFHLRARRRRTRTSSGA